MSDVIKVESLLNEVIDLCFHFLSNYIYLYYVETYFMLCFNFT